MSIEQLQNEAIDFLRLNLVERPVFVGFSGGKDSLAVAKLLELSGLPYRLYYSATGIDPPQVVHFIKRNYPDAVFLKPRRTFWHDITTNNPPANFSRWCCKTLKKEPSAKLPFKQRVLGIRAEESSRRSNYERINHDERTGFTYYYPIFHWNTYQIWSFLEYHRVNYPFPYNLGFDRLGCVVCPYHSEPSGRVHARYRKYWSRYFKLFEKYAIAHWGVILGPWFFMLKWIDELLAKAHHECHTKIDGSDEEKIKKIRKYIEEAKEKKERLEETLKEQVKDF